MSMAMRTPQWWYRKDAQGAPWWRFALWPLSLLWLSVNAIKAMTACPYRSRLKVISVGNVTLGGSGKTPIVAELLRLLGGTSAGLSRGYGGAVSGPIRVDCERDSAADVGDEPLMLAADHEFWISRDRAAGLRAIEASKATTVVVDDAHQNVKIAKDVHILVVDGDTSNGAWPFGDGGICPNGPMREPLRDGLARADIVVVWLPDDRPAAPDLLRLLAATPVFLARLVAEAPYVASPVVGYAGIAKPWKFADTLKRLGVELEDFHAFPDHVSPSEANLADMCARGQVITTQKDWVRLSPAWRDKVVCLPIRARFDDEVGLLRAINPADRRA